MSLNQLTITQAHNGLKKKEFSSVELTEAVLSQIKERDRQIHLSYSDRGIGFIASQKGR